MLPTPLKKALADLAGNRVRSLLVVLSIAVGVFAVGTVASAFSIVQRDMRADYLAANPHSARIYTSDFDWALVDSLVALPDVVAVEARYNLWVKIAGPSGVAYPINLDSITSAGETTVDRLAFVAGSDTLADGEIYLERQGAEGLGLEPGDAVTLILNDGRSEVLTVAGTVHDVMANPFTFTSQTSGYVTRATMANLGGSALNNYVSIVTFGSQADEVRIRAIADRVAAAMTERGVTVYNVNITNPGQHPAQSIIDTVLMLMGVLTALVILLGAFLVTNTVAALMGQQVRQIGMMKAVGATMGQVVAMYVSLLMAFGLLALAIAVPLAGLAAWGLSGWLIGMLNATPAPFAIPPASLALQLVIGLAVPVLAGLVPVIGGARRTVREAMTNYGVEASTRPGPLDRISDALPWIPRPTLLSLRNAFRRKARLLLTLATLTLGGSVLIAMFGVRESLYVEIDRSHGYTRADVNVDLDGYYARDQLTAAAEDIPGVKAVEGWQIVTASVARSDRTTGDQVVLHAPPAGTELVEPVLSEGRWLLPTDEDAVAVSNQFIALRPDVRVGDALRILVGDAEVDCTVVGIFRMAGTYASPYLFVPDGSLARLTGTEGRVNSLRMETTQHDRTAQAKVVDLVLARLAETGVGAAATTGAEVIEQQRSQIDLLIALLMALGALIALVGGLGLMGTMGMSVLERTREIGVLRSIGAGNASIFQMVVVEGATIGVISWVLGMLLAIPVTHLLDSGLGTRLMTIPIVYLYSVRGALIWLVIALVLATVASLLPARNAVRLTVRDVLAYE